MTNTGMFFHSKSVVKPSAMINNHVQANGIPISEVTRVAMVIESNAGLLGKYYYLFMLLKSSGARFSEVQDIKWNEISSSGSVLIRGRKGSNDRVIEESKVSEWLLKCKSNQVCPFIGCNIFTATRHLIRLGVMMQKKGRKRMTVTGIFRELYAQQVRSIQVNPSTLSRSLGHKVLANAEYYGKN